MKQQRNLGPFQRLGLQKPPRVLGASPALPWHRGPRRELAARGAPPPTAKCWRPAPAPAPRGTPGTGGKYPAPRRRLPRHIWRCSPPQHEAAPRTATPGWVSWWRGKQASHGATHPGDSVEGTAWPPASPGTHGTPRLPLTPALSSFLGCSYFIPGKGSGKVSPCHPPWATGEAGCSESSCRGLQSRAGIPASPATPAMKS